MQKWLFVSLRDKILFVAATAKLGNAKTLAEIDVPDEVVAALRVEITGATLKQTVIAAFAAAKQGDLKSAGATAREATVHRDFVLACARTGAKLRGQ